MSEVWQLEEREQEPPATMKSKLRKKRDRLE